VSARKKLNYAYLNGAIVVAGLVGGLTGSWPVFFIAATALCVGAIYAGDVRFTNRRH
jgi:hypothetical protein